MIIKFIKATPFAIDQNANHAVEKQFGDLMVKNGCAQEITPIKIKKHKNEK